MATETIPLEFDDRWFTVIASSPTVVLTQHINGSLGLWRLEWRDRGNYPPGFEGDAWAAYMRAQTDG